MGTTSLSEFNPQWVTTMLQTTSPFADAYPAAGNPNRLPALLPAGVAGAQVSSAVQRHTYALTATAPTTLTLNLLYFPGWEARIQRASLPVAPQPPLGLLSVAMPAGEHLLEVVYTGTWSQWIGELIALGAWLVLAVGGVWLLLNAAAVARCQQQRRPAGKPLAASPW